MKTVNLLLDLLYFGKTDSVGDIDPISGDLCLGQLYNCLVLSSENGGLPDILDLEVVTRDKPIDVDVGEDLDSSDVKIIGIFNVGRSSIRDRMISGEDDNTLHTDNYDVGVKLSQFCEQSDDTPSNEKINEEQFSDYYSCEELHESNIEDASTEKPSESFLDDEPLDNPYDSVDEILGSDNEDHESGISAEKEELLPSDPKESGPDINNIGEGVLKVS